MRQAIVIVLNALRLMKESAMGYINQLIENYGYAAVFIVLALGLFSLPIPDEVMVLLVGYFTKIGLLHYSFSLLAVFSGSFIGMLVSYEIGKRIGRPLLTWLGKWLSFSLKWSNKAEGWIQKYGAPAIIVSYFVPGMRHVTGYFCGSSHMPLKSYMLYAGVSALLWSLLFLTVGRIF
ncbi:DedA family protein [Bacillus tropicus]|uniref:DedA family protein n=3 Tax=Bacillus TaxID=1386 RepID=UPI002DB8CCB0|nr:DedA family protein [Bacillus tropicus]MDF9614157.1 DedA family protein [Bacillus cereus]MEC2926566.1 DedA family protein [Bacillus tropicus]MEC3089705.1 DedA family protein [Bacillus tropicus]